MLHLVVNKGITPIFCDAQKELHRQWIDEFWHTIADIQCKQEKQLSLFGKAGNV